MSDRSRELREKYKNLQKEHIQVCTENKQFKGEYAKRKYVMFSIHQISKNYYLFSKNYYLS